jgi:predicted component of viral defense system (DUF524 family)
VNSPEPERLIDVANHVACVSISESIPLVDLEGHVKLKEEEEQRLKEEIQQARAILESTNVEIQTISRYKQLSAELSKHSLSSEDTDRLLTLLNNIKQYRYDPRKTAEEISNIKSLKRREHLCKLIKNILYISGTIEHAFSKGSLVITSITERYECKP